MNGTSLNEALVFNGLAWWYYQFAPNEKRLEDLQKVAQVERRNLWSEKNPIPPWDFRKGKVKEDSTITNTYSQPQQTTDNTVYVTNSGDKYHSESCRFL